MRVRVQFSGQLRTALGRAAEEVELPEGCTAALLVEQLAAQFSAAASHLLTASGDVPSGLLVVVNDAAVAAGQLPATRLRPGDVISLLPPIAGG